MNDDQQRNPRELLSRAQIEAEYGIPAATQRVWYRENTYGWRGLVISVGSLKKVMRRDVDKWLESRRGLTAEPTRRGKHFNQEQAAV